ncbi:hypothetical protein CAEBREN_11251 [Caenorhabditis brenneri]|uniref:Histone-lysine N-methyltransferase, H3 lysine-79 specific n=1 Tax=Caenorhabditis brenneri TaxID=135651 RepID=G0P848_CAEBE|nr:hypothetical protein CAEBREN_11251 [Caenorhabditis brenneri]
MVPTPRRGNQPSTSSVIPAAERSQVEEERPLERGECVKIRSVFIRGCPLQMELEDRKNWMTIATLLRTIESYRILKLERNCFEVDPTTADDVRDMVEMYTREQKVYSKLQKTNGINPKHFGIWNLPECNYKTACNIVQTAVEHSIPNQQVLNKHYRPATSETYGETNFCQMESICKELKIGENDVFVDLGSGVGQLVCFMSAYARCKKSIGIELSQQPAEFAAKVGNGYKCLMKFFGKRAGHFELHRGDMLDNRFRQLILQEATVIFINNFAFSPSLMLRLKENLLSYLGNGVRIVTTKALEKSVDLNERSADGFNSISDTRELRSLPDNVSWSSSTVQFYCTTMNVDKLFKYHEERRRRPSGSPEYQEEQVERRTRGRPRTSGYNSPSTSAGGKRVRPIQMEDECLEQDSEEEPPVKRTE